MEKFSLNAWKNISKQDKLLKNIKNDLFKNLFYQAVGAKILFKKFTDKNFYKKFKQLSAYVSKTKTKESYQMVKLLFKNNKTQKEKQFVKEHLVDLSKIGIVWGVGMLPGWSIIVILLSKLWINLLPSSLKKSKLFEDSSNKWKE